MHGLDGEALRLALLYEEIRARGQVSPSPVWGERIAIHSFIFRPWPVGPVFPAAGAHESVDCLGSFTTNFPRPNIAKISPSTLRPSDDIILPPVPCRSLAKAPTTRGGQARIDFGGVPFLGCRLLLLLLLLLRGRLHILPPAAKRLQSSRLARAPPFRKTRKPDAPRLVFNFE